ncbi:UNVERIFIED_CONTAM: hypothetical protein FKN15_053888 [Acipenser sinensis]
MPLNSAALSSLFVFLPPAESENPAPAEWERAQLGVGRSEREWDEVIQVVVKSLLERTQTLPESPALPEGEYPMLPRRERPMLPVPEPQRESPASPECPVLPPEKEKPVPQLPPESSAPQLLAVSRAAQEKVPYTASERLHSNTSERVPPTAQKSLSCTNGAPEREPSVIRSPERRPRAGVVL